MPRRPIHDSLRLEHRHRPRASHGTAVRGQRLTPAAGGATLPAVARVSGGGSAAGATAWGSGSNGAVAVLVTRHGRPD